MNNREIVDFILSNKLSENDVIKRIYDEECTMYLFNDGFMLQDDNGEVSIFSFCDDDCKIIYQVISKEQALKEIENKEKKEKIQKLKQELAKLEEDSNE